MRQSTQSRSLLTSRKITNVYSSIKRLLLTNSRIQGYPRLKVCKAFSTSISLSSNLSVRSSAKRGNRVRPIRIRQAVTTSLTTKISERRKNARKTTTTMTTTTTTSKTNYSRKTVRRLQVPPPLPGGPPSPGPQGRNRPTWRVPGRTRGRSSRSKIRLFRTCSTATAPTKA